MKYVNLGRSGLKVSRICLGTLTFGSKEWRPYILTEEESRPIIERALDLGINFFDTADMYSLGVSEEILGRALADMAQRSEVVIASKVYFKMGQDPNSGGLSRKHIMDAVDKSLTRLGTEYLDLYQIHRWDDETPIEETLRALDDLVAAGKVRYLGASSMYTWQFARALFTADIHGWSRFVSMQNHYNLVYREEEREMIPLCQDQGIGLIPWSPLARGFLAGNRHRDGGGDTVRARNDPLADEFYYRPSDFEVVERVGTVAEGHGVSPAQIALAWLLHKPGVTAPIVGVRSIRHLEESVNAVSVSLTEAEMQMLEDAYEPHPILGHD
jgi:aryl-alcohol dehydrogenase-like predicted oxidoreductase